MNEKDLGIKKFFVTEILPLFFKNEVLKLKKAQGLIENKLKILPQKNDEIQIVRVIRGIGNSPKLDCLFDVILVWSTVAESFDEDPFSKPHLLFLSYKEQSKGAGSPSLISFSNTFDAGYYSLKGLFESQWENIEDTFSFSENNIRERSLV